MRKLFIVGMIGAFTLGAATLAFAGSSERRIASTSRAESTPVRKDLGEINRRLSQSTHAKVNCKSVKCVNQTLTRLSKDVKNLKRDAFQCEQVVNVTSYDGYLYSPDGGATVFGTTALDYTDTGDVPTDQFVVYTC